MRRKSVKNLLGNRSKTSSLLKSVFAERNVQFLIPRCRVSLSSQERMWIPSTTNLPSPKTVFALRSVGVMWPTYPSLTYLVFDHYFLSNRHILTYYIGLIVSISSAGSEGDIELVKGLVESYISKPSCLILLTVACESMRIRHELLYNTSNTPHTTTADFENQGAFRIAKKHDVKGRRTIGNFLKFIICVLSLSNVLGVLTKPDRIPLGDEDDWIRFIKNDREPLVNGWYAVKQPNSKMLRAGITWADAREDENQFFTTTSPWAGLNADCQSRLRTRNLIDCLSRILSELIAKRFLFSIILCSAVNG
jgi:hypothetical protein